MRHHPVLALSTSYTPSRSIVEISDHALTSCTATELPSHAHQHDHPAARAALVSRLVLSYGIAGSATSGQLWWQPNQGLDERLIVNPSMYHHHPCNRLLFTTDSVSNPCLIQLQGFISHSRSHMHPRHRYQQWIGVSADNLSSIFPQDSSIATTQAHVLPPAALVHRYLLML